MKKISSKMKTIALTIAFAVFALAAVSAQDIITKTNGDEIQAKVIEVSQTEVKYKKFSNRQGPTYTLPIAEIFMIKYENGNKDVFDNKQAAENIQTPVVAKAETPAAQPHAVLDGKTPVSTAEELMRIGKDDASLQGSYILLNDITVDNWTPIGDNPNSSDEAQFAGLLDGNGHCITVLSIAKGATEGKMLSDTKTGLFCIIGKNGIVKNLRIAGDMTHDSGTRTLYLGAVAGENRGKIQNCISTCSITAKGGKINFGRDYLVGLMGAGTNSVILYENGAYAGGITGLNMGRIENCYATGNIVIDGDGIKCGGGITGGNGARDGGTVIQCFTSGTVTCTGTGGVGKKGFYRMAGCVAGQNVGTIENCVAFTEALTAYHINCITGADRAFDAAGGASRTAGGKVKDSFYSPDITIFKEIDVIDGKATANAKTGKGMSGLPVDIETAQTQIWWETPKNRKAQSFFLFGNSDESPWVWNKTLKRPALYWEK